MRLKTIFAYLFVFVICVSCESDAQDFVSHDSYDAIIDKTTTFGTLTDSPSLFPLEKTILLSPTQKYGGGFAFASVCKKTEDNYLLVSTGYEKYDDFAFSELINIDINVNDIKQFEETSLFQQNIAKIQTGGISLLKINDKTILSFFYAKESTKSIDIYMKKSIDNGLTWSSPTIISEIKNAYQHCANNRAILLTNGRIILPMAIGGTGSPNYIFCYYSDDFGNTWKSTKMFKTNNNSLYEPCIEELSTGKLIMTLRNSSGKIIFCFSNDDGITWTDFVKSNLNCPDAPSTIARMPGKNWLLLIWNNNERIFDYHFRSPLSLAVSKDEGKSWIYLFDIENRPNIGAYYPTMNFTEDKLLITYTQKNTGDMKSSVVFSKISISSLEDLISKKTN